MSDRYLDEHEDGNAGPPTGSSNSRSRNGQHVEGGTWTVHGDDGESSSDEEHTPRDYLDDREYQLRLAHSMAHNPVDSLLPSPPRSPYRTPGSPKRTRVVTVDDVENRTCWICSDGDSDDDENAQPRTWVHPCKCSLVAHEDCLLAWIRSRRQGGSSPDPNRTITCPQCSYPYQIMEKKPFLLRLFEAGDKVLRNLIPLASLGVVGGGALVAATAYGCVAIRVWMGKQAAARTLGGRWPWHFYFDIPLIPFALILSRFRLLDRAMMWLPTIVAFPVMHVPLAAATMGTYPSPYTLRRTWQLRQPRSDPFLHLRPWPPGPAMTIILVPWVRVMYLSLKRRITRKVLAPFARHSLHGSLPQRPAQRHNVIIVGNEVPQDGNNAEATVGVDENGLPRELPPGAEAVDQDRTIYVSPQSLAKLCLGALGSPFIANAMGQLLAKVASLSYWMRCFLGMEGAWRRHLDLRQAVLPKDSQSTPLANLLSTGSLSRSDAPHSAHNIQYSYLDGNDPYGPPQYKMTVSYDDLDPVWFRNTIGAGVFVLAKDMLQLSFRYLRLEHARQGSKRTKIVDRPFEGRMIEGLDLRPR